MFPQQVVLGHPIYHSALRTTLTLEHMLDGQAPCLPWQAAITFVSRKIYNLNFITIEYGKPEVYSVSLGFFKYCFSYRVKRPTNI